MPADGMPVVRDWATCWESMLTGGIELQREPLSVNAQSSEMIIVHMFPQRVLSCRGLRGRPLEPEDF